jgi:putative sterol carrier protein
MNAEELTRVLEGLNTAFIPERAKGLDAVIQIEITGEGDYTLLIRDEKISFQAGKTPGARLTLKANVADLVAIFQRKLDPTTAFFQGRLSVQGDVGLAMKLPGLFS